MIMLVRISSSSTTLEIVYSFVSVRFSELFASSTFFFFNLTLSDPREIHELQASIKLKLYCNSSWKRYYPWQLHRFERR